MPAGRYFRGALNELSNLFEKAVDLVARKTTRDPSGHLLPPSQHYEYATLGHPGMFEGDLHRLLGTSGSPNFITNEDLRALNDVQYNPRDREILYPELSDIQRLPEDPYFTVHTHPGGFPSPSITDLRYLLSSRPDPTRHAMGVVGISNSMSPRSFAQNPRGSTVVTREVNDVGFPSPERARDLHYLEKYYDENMPRRVAQDPYIRGMYTAHIPVEERGSDYDTVSGIYNEMKDLGVLPPLLRLANQDRYHVLYDVGNMPSRTHAWDSNDKLEELYRAMTSRGLLDYHEGGLV